MGAQFDNFVSDQKQQKLDARAKRLLVEKIRDYGQQGDAAGCPPEQMENFMRAGIWLYPKQLQFAAMARLCDLPDGPTKVGLGGSRSPGKTHCIMAQMCADDCQRFAGLKFLLLRKVVKANKEQFNDFKVKICMRLPNNYREQVGQLEFSNGSKIVIGHFKDEKDIENYLGLEYDAIAVEELTTLSFEKFKNILSCLRTSKTGWRPRLYASWNWGGVSHAEMKRLFYDPMIEKREKDTRFIPCTVYDNPGVNKEYIDYLESLTGWKRQSWLLGNPNFQAGQFFTNWSHEHHVLRAFDDRKIVRWYGSLDYGRTHPTVFLLSGEDKEGNLYVLYEHSESQMTIEEHSICIHAILRKCGLTPSDLYFIAAGRDCFSAKDDGTTISDSYAAQGLMLEPAEIDRINGWAKCLERLGDPEKGIKPTLFVHERCTKLREQIPMAQHHEKRPEDVEKFDYDEESGMGGDDSLDCLRFLVSTSPSGVMRICSPVGLGGYEPIAIDIG